MCALPDVTEGGRRERGGAKRSDASEDGFRCAQPILGSTHPTGGTAPAAIAETRRSRPKDPCAAAPPAVSRRRGRTHRAGVWRPSPPSATAPPPARPCARQRTLLDRRSVV